MQRVSVFDWFTRTAPDKVEWALAYYEVSESIAEEIEVGDITPIYDIPEIVEDFIILE